MAKKTIDLNGLKDYQDKLKRAPEDIKKRVYAEASSSSQDVATGARLLAPVDVANLRASIQVDGGNGKYAVSASANYAAYIEFGTGTAVSIPAGLEDYARTFFVSGKGALPARPFLFPSLEKERPNLIKRLKKILDSL